MATLKLEIVTPEEKIYSEDVEMVTLPGSEGELGVYPKHVPLLTTLVPGELRVLKNGRETAMAIGEGFVEIKADAVSVLTDMALESEKIDMLSKDGIGLFSKRGRNDFFYASCSRCIGEQSRINAVSGDDSQDIWRCLSCHSEPFDFAQDRLREAKSKNPEYQRPGSATGSLDFARDDGRSFKGWSTTTRDGGGV